MNRNPICPVLVDPTLVICPNVGAVTVVLGLFNCRQLNTLNDSKRNWICEVPRKVNVFANVRSTRRRPGPRTSEEFWLPGRIVARVVAEVSTSVYALRSRYCSVSRQSSNIWLPPL